MKGTLSSQHNLKKDSIGRRTLPDFKLPTGNSNHDSVVLAQG